MQCLVVLDELVNAAAQDLVFKEVAIFYGFGYSREVLVYHPACTEVHVANFRIAHLAVRQADLFARGLDEGVRVAIQEVIESGRVCIFYGVVALLFSISKTVQNNEHMGFTLIQFYSSVACGKDFSRKPSF